MANIKPARYKTGHEDNKTIEARLKAEEALQGSTSVRKVSPKSLSEEGKKIYGEIISLLPHGFLNGGDTYTVGVVAEVLDRMQSCQIKLNDEGVFNELGEENPAVKTYNNYAKTFEKFSSKLGLSPKDRASLAVLMLNQEDESKDLLLKTLRGE